MKNNIHTPNRFRDTIRTKHVFIEDAQVFIKKETNEAIFEDTTVAEWFPTDFKWIPARI